MSLVCSALVIWFYLLLVGCLVQNAASSYQCFELKSLNTEICNQCEFGSECVLSARTNATCRCIQRCYSYGDSVDSQKVCNSDGLTYESICHLKKHSCEAKKEIAIRFFGKCGRLWICAISRREIELTILLI